MPRQQVDGCHFLDCTRKTEGIEDQLKSALAFYKAMGDDGNVDGHLKADDIVDLTTTGFRDFEVPGSIVFPNSGVTFNWNIEKNAHLLPDGTEVGTASNSVGQNFTVVKRQRELFVSADGFACTTLFFCF